MNFIIVNCLDGKASGAHLPFFDSYMRISNSIFSIDFKDNTFIIHYPLMGHEIISGLFTELQTGGKWHPQSSYNGSYIYEGGSADIKLADGVKSPDYSLYESSDKGAQARMESFPTIVWEVAYSENSRKLAQDAARHICGSQGEILLAIAVDVHVTPSRELQSMSVAFWELEAAEEVVKWKGDFNVLTRCDGGDDNGDTVPLPGKRYMMISTVAKTPVKYTAFESKVFTVSALRLSNWTFLIFNRYILRFMITRHRTMLCIYCIDIYTGIHYPGMKIKP
jgi:hypothetical protein